MAFYLDMGDREILSHAIDHDMRALSVRIPYVLELLSGSKTEEYRSKPVRFRGPVLLYASQTLADMSAYTKEDQELMALQSGRIVGIIEVVGSIERGPDDHAWQVANPRAFETSLNVPSGTRAQPAFWRPFRSPPIRFTCALKTQDSSEPTLCGTKHRTMEAADKCCARMMNKYPMAEWSLWGFA
jgi:hypothetical protein